MCDAIQLNNDRDFDLIKIKNGNIPVAVKPINFTAY